MKRNTSAAKAIVCTVVLWTIPLLLAAQRSVPKLEDLPRRAIDTLDTDDSNIKIVIFTNNTWCYYYPDLNERMDPSRDLAGSVCRPLTNIPHCCLP